MVVFVSDGCPRRFTTTRDTPRKLANRSQSAERNQPLRIDGHRDLVPLIEQLVSARDEFTVASARDAPLEDGVSHTDGIARLPGDAEGHVPVDGPAKCGAGASNDLQSMCQSEVERDGVSNDAIASSKSATPAPAASVWIEIGSFDGRERSSRRDRQPDDRLLRHHPRGCVTGLDRGAIVARCSSPRHRANPAVPDKRIGDHR